MEKVEPTSRFRTPKESLAFSEVHTPGCYVGRGTGDLYRIPVEALGEGQNPQVEIVSTPPRVVTKITDDPWIPINKARHLAADADLTVGF